MQPLKYSGLRSKTSPGGFSVFLSYERSMCKTEMEYPRVPFQNASQCMLIILPRRTLKTYLQ